MNLNDTLQKIKDHRNDPAINALCKALIEAIESERVALEALYPNSLVNTMISARETLLECTIRNEIYQDPETYKELFL